LNLLFTFLLYLFALPFCFTFLLYLFALPFCFTFSLHHRKLIHGQKERIQRADLDSMTTISRLKILDLLGHEIKVWTQQPSKLELLSFSPSGSARQWQNGCRYRVLKRELPGTRDRVACSAPLTECHIVDWRL